MLVSVILPTVRTGSVAAAIEAVMRQSDEHWELLIVYQGDDQDLATLVKDYEGRDPRITGIHAQESNLSHARNVGMAAARGEVLAFTDDDCEVAPDWIAAVRKAFTDEPLVGVFGGEVVAEPNTQPWRISTCPAAHVVEGVYVPGRDDEPPPGFYMIGANFCVRREAAERVGQFDEVLGAGARFACCEDQDFIFRAESLGYGLMTSKSSVVYHTTGRRYGVKQFVKHQRNYARGRGAWAAKLRLWGHPLGEVWSRPTSFQDGARRLVRRPDRWLLERFAAHHAKQAANEYVSEYLLDEAVMSVPRGTVEQTYRSGRGSGSG
jgi:GT2 family glycosyltransferase